jgi:hypothetical protein
MPNVDEAMRWIGAANVQFAEIWPGKLASGEVGRIPMVKSALISVDSTAEFARACSNA